MPAGDGRAKSEAQMVGERRQLTVLFCDLVNYTGLTESLDSEDVAELILAYQEAGRNIFTRYGGYIAQFLGDGLLVYFGYPQAHEDDAARSVAAALELLGELDHIRRTHAPNAEDLRFEARVGIHTGQAVVGLSAGTERSVIFGETVNIAARLQSMAEPGTVLVSEATQALLRGGFAYESAGPLSLKGVTRPIEAFRITKATGTPRWSSPAGDMVDRAAERERLAAEWRLARAGACRGVTISGEAGVGKSTLLTNLQTAIAAEPHLWLQAQCTAMAEATPLHPFIELIRRRLNISDAMPEDEQLSKLREGLGAAGLASPDAFQLMAQLLSLNAGRTDGGESPEIARTRTLETLRAWLEGLAKQAPVVLVCEDMHWSDPSALELAAQLVERRTPLPMLCIVTHRPHFKFQCAVPLEAIALDGLKQADALELVKIRAGAAPPPTETFLQIVARAGGNPLFLEELTKLTAGTAAAGATLALPPTLEALLMAQLDRLGPQPKRTAQIAATLGREFDLALLSSVLDAAPDQVGQAIAHLADQNIVRSEDAATQTYAFRHALIRDAAYESLLKSERRKIHARVADALRSKFAERAERQPELVAWHLNGAEQYVEAADWYRKAGLRAAGQAAIDEASVHYRRGLESLASVKPSPARDRLEMSLQILLGNALMGVRGFSSPELLPVWERACALAESLNDANETTSALNGLAVYRMSVGDCHAAVELGEKILSLAAAGQDRIGRLRAHSTIATALMQIGDVPKALEHANLGIASYEPGDFKLVTYGVGTDQGLIAYAGAAGAEWWLGRPDIGLERARAGVRLVEQLDSALSLAAAKAFLALNHWFRREFDVAHQIADENYAFCERLQFPFWSGFSLLLRASRCVAGSTQALDDANAALEKLARTASRTGVAVGFIILAEAQRAAGNIDAALGVAGMGLQLCQALRQHFLDAELLRLQGELLAANGDREGGEKALRAALTEATTKSAQSLRLRSAVSLHRLLRDAESLSLLADARRHIQGGADTPDMRAAAELLS